MFEPRELTMYSILLRMLLAVLIGGILGSERERLNRPAGLRTYILVCLGSCICMMTNQYVAQAFETGDPVRMGAQVISGIGFLGAGSIIMTGKNRVSGLTTAAGLWAAAGLGLAIGIGLYEAAAVGGALIFLVLTGLHSVDSMLHSRRRIVDVYVESSSPHFVRGFIDYLRNHGLVMYNLQIEPADPNLSPPCVSLIATVKSREKRNHDDILTLLKETPNIQYIEEI